MKSLLQYFNILNHTKSHLTLNDFWNVKSVSKSGVLYADDLKGFIFKAEGLDGSFLSSEQWETLHDQWRSTLRMSPGDEMQIVFHKRVAFSDWIEEQLSQAFMAENTYGRQILLDRLSQQITKMGKDQPHLLSQKIIISYWTKDPIEASELEVKRNMVKSQISSFGFNIKTLDKNEISKEISSSAQNLMSYEQSEPEWPSLKIEAGHIKINKDHFRALELSKLPESVTELGMIEALTCLPYPLDICIRLKSQDVRPVISKLERKKNLLNAKRDSKSSASPYIESQLEQIDQVLRSIADRSESIFKMSLTVGLRFPESLRSFHRRALADIIRSGSKMNFCEFDEHTLGTFDAYLECLPSFKGKNIKYHTVLSSNAIHFLPFFRPSKGDQKQVVSFQTKTGTIYGINPIDSKLANYNWLISGTSGAGKSFFVNSLIAQSSSINPNIYIVDIGGSYNKLTQFLGGRVMSLEPGQGFKISPFFLPKNSDPNEEQLRRQHILQIFLEMIRIDGQLPSIEVRHLLNEALQELFDLDQLPDHPISELVTILSKISTPEAHRLVMLLEPWSGKSYFANFLDNNKSVMNEENILTFDLKGLTDFEDLSRVVQLILCASLWAKIRQANGKQFSWIVLDEVAFSLLKVQPQFVDELVSTLRKHFAGAVIVVQDLEKVTSNLAGSSILQNSQTKAILQQRGNPKNYAEVLSLSTIDQWAINSLRREKGSFSDIFLIRDNEKTVVRHVPSMLEYWIATTAPEDNHIFSPWMEKSDGEFKKNMIDFVAYKRGEAP